MCPIFLELCFPGWKENKESKESASHECPINAFKAKDQLAWLGFNIAVKPGYLSKRIISLIRQILEPHK